jgi:hypothetical protein
MPTLDAPMNAIPTPESSPSDSPNYRYSEDVLPSCYDPCAGTKSVYYPYHHPTSLRGGVGIASFPHGATPCQLMSDMNQAHQTFTAHTPADFSRRQSYLIASPTSSSYDPRLNPTPSIHGPLVSYTQTSVNAAHRFTASVHSANFP